MAYLRYAEVQGVLSLLLFNHQYVPPRQLTSFPSVYNNFVGIAKVPLAKRIVRSSGPNHLEKLWRKIKEADSTENRSIMPLATPTSKLRNLEPSANGPPTLPPFPISSRVEDGFITQSLEPESTTHLPKSLPVSRNASTGTVRRTHIASSTALPYGHGQHNYFRSRRINKDEIEQAWLDKKDPREKWVTIIPIIGFCLGLAVAALLIWMGLWTVVDHNYCLVLDEDFSFWNDKVWTKEVEVGGYG
jgi:hypothetical protein